MALNLDRIQKSLRKVKKFVKKAPSQPTPGQVHDLRINTRKVESALHALSLDSRSNERRLLKSVKRIRKRAGKIRDMDVLTSGVCSVKVRGEGDCEVQLLEHLGAQRHKYAKKLRSTVLKESAVLKKTLRREAAELGALMQDGKPDQAAAEAGAHALDLASQLTDPPRLNRNNLHPYRLKVKELRYVLQIAENNGKADFVKDLGEVKDAIGEWHDWEGLVSIANDVLDHGSGCRLQQELKRISKSKYEHALALATKLRKTYLKTSARKDSRTDTSPQFRPPVLLATAALTSGSQKRAA